MGEWWTARMQAALMPSRGEYDRYMAGTPALRSSTGDCPVPTAGGAELCQYLLQLTLPS
jgi:hypothetical protein